jgi:hypothetical protein
MSLYETEMDYGELDEYQEEAGTFEETDQFLGDAGGLVGEADSPLNEEEEIDLASQLLEITDEAELDQFLGDLIKKAGRAVGKVVRSPVGQALGGVLKKVAKTALPAVGGAIGSFIAPGVGTALGTKLGSMATRLFELEPESETMDESELELEVARRVVRLATSSAQNAAAAPARANPAVVAKKAVVRAARTQAPKVAALVARTPTRRLVATRTAPLATRRPRAGRWVRRGSTIVVYGG